jgi:hypothetical protein
MLMRGVTAGVATLGGGDRYELRIVDEAGSALILLPVPADELAEADAFAASVRYAASGTSAGRAVV